MKKNKTDKLGSNITSVKLIKAYYIMFAVSALLSLIMMLLTDGQSFTKMLFYGSQGSDTFMDFYNSIRDASTKNVYKEGIIYPPLANVFFFFLSKMIPAKLASSPFAFRLSLQKDTTCIFIYLTFVFLCLLLYLKILKAELVRRDMPKLSYSLPLLLCFSFPVIYCVQRGNIALLSILLSMFFVFYRNSENKWLRELSFVLLAVAAGLKLYPAMFGLLLLTDKQYKRAGRLIIYGLIFLVVPFFFYDGFGSILDIIKNIKEFADPSLKRPTPSFVSVDIFALYAQLFLKMNYKTVYYFLFALTYAAALMILFIMPEEWQKVMAVSFMIMNYTATSRSYILVLLLIPFTLFLCKKSYRKRDLVYFALFSVLLLVLPTLYFNHIETITDIVANKFDFGETGRGWAVRYLAQPNQLVSAFAVQGMMAFMFLDMLVRIQKNEVLKIKPRRKKATAVAESSKPSAEEIIETA